MDQPVNNIDAVAWRVLDVLLHEAAKPRQVSRDAEEEDVQMEAKALNIIHTLEFP